MKARNVDIQATPPHSVEAEMGVLSSIMHDCQSGSRRVIAEVTAKINEHFFYVPAHKTVFEMLVSLWRADRPIDLIGFTEFMRKKRVLDSVGGPAALTELHTYIDKLTGFVPTAATVGYYVETMIKKYKLRESIATWTQGVRRLYQPGVEDEDGLQNLRDDIESRIAAIYSLGDDGALSAHDAAEMIAKPIVLPSDVIEGVLHQGGKASFGGASKSRKTWVLLDIAISVASETPWLGFPTRKGKVLYVNFELPEAFCWKRIRTICDAGQITLEPGALRVWNLRGRVRDWPRLQQQIRLGEYVLIVIDPVYKLLLLVGESIRDENRTGGVATVLDQMDALTERTGAAIAFGAHFSKGDQAKKESIDRVSGTGVWARDPDAIINFTALSTDDSYAVDMDLRSYPPQKPFAVRWEYPEFIRADELDPTQLKKRKPSGAAEKQYDVQELVALLEEPMRAGEYQELAKEEIGMKERTFYSLFAEAKENGLIIADKDRKWQRNPNPPNPE